MRPHLNCELNSENVQTFLRRWEVLWLFICRIFMQTFLWIWCITRSAYLPPVSFTCHCSFIFFCNARIWHTRKPQKCVTIHIYLCNVDVFVHICVIFPGWRRWQQLLVSNAVSTFPKQLTHTTQQFAASETLKSNTKNMQSGPDSW